MYIQFVPNVVKLECYKRVIGILLLCTLEDRLLLDHLTKPAYEHYLSETFDFQCKQHAV